MIIMKERTIVYEIDKRWIKELTMEGRKVARTLYDSETPELFWLRGVDCFGKRNEILCDRADAHSVYECKFPAFSTQLECSEIGGTRKARGSVVRTPFRPIMESV